MLLFLFLIQLTFWKHEAVFHLLGSMTRWVPDRWSLAGSVSLALAEYLGNRQSDTNDLVDS
jgi:hypothetical protein